MKISAIISWPDSFDFPIFRKNLSLLQKEVDEIIVCFNQHGNYSLRLFLKDLMPNVKILDVENANGSYQGDWRNKSTKYMIDNATGDYILSLEQDFFIKDYPHFFNTVKNSKTDIVCFMETNRMHPAFLLVKKDLVKDPGLDFSVMGQGMDHFALVTKALKNYSYSSLESLGLVGKEDWYHLRGLTDNYFAPKPYFSLDEFYTYNIRCLNSDIPQIKYWYDLMGELNKNAPQDIKYQEWMTKFL